MLIRARPLLTVVLGLGVPGAAAGQRAWVPHQPPCKLNTGHFLINGSQLHLKLAVESRFADQRAGRLDEARTVLHRAILEAGQAENPAAWYYLGRTYVEQEDLAGADSAFRRALALAPDCAEDVAQYAQRAAALALTAGLQAWGNRQIDSARAALGLARSLDAGDAEIPLYLSIMFASASQPESAARYLDVGRELARTDTAHAARLKQATLDVARAWETRAYETTPAPTLADTRAGRDSTVSQVARDSALFDKIITEVGGIRARGQHLNPQALAAFQRDSSTLATRLATGRPARDSLRAMAASDSAAAAAALAPAIAAYTGYVDAFPEEGDATVPLIRLLAAAGDRQALDDVARRAAASPHISGATLVQAALELYRGGLSDAAATLVDAALSRNANDHGALGIATYVYHAQARTDALLEVARRRLALAPLDPAAARAMALAWDLAGRRDSVDRYLALADTGLGWHVTITQFAATERTTSVNGYVVNAGTTPRPATELVFELLDTDGTVRFTDTVPVPELAPRARAPIALRVEEGGAASWRYRRP